MDRLRLDAGQAPGQARLLIWGLVAPWEQGPARRQPSDRRIEPGSIRGRHSRLCRPPHARDAGPGLRLRLAQPFDLRHHVGLAARVRPVARGDFPLQPGHPGLLAEDPLGAPGRSRGHTGSDPVAGASKVVDAGRPGDRHRRLAAGLARGPEEGLGPTRRLRRLHRLRLGDPGHRGRRLADRGGGGRPPGGHGGRLSVGLPDRWSGRRRGGADPGPDLWLARLLRADGGPDGVGRPGGVRRAARDHARRAPPAPCGHGRRARPGGRGMAGATRPVALGRPAAGLRPRRQGRHPGGHPARAETPPLGRRAHGGVEREAGRDLVAAGRRSGRRRGHGAGGMADPARAHPPRPLSLVGLRRAPGRLLRPLQRYGRADPGVDLRLPAVGLRAQHHEPVLPGPGVQYDRGGRGAETVRPGYDHGRGVRRRSVRGQTGGDAVDGHRRLRPADHQHHLRLAGHARA